MTRRSKTPRPAWSYRSERRNLAREIVKRSPDNIRNWRKTRFISNRFSIMKGLPNGTRL